MPTYRVTGPDGKTYQVQAPAGATREQVLERVKGQVYKKRDTASGALDAFMRGAGDMITFGLADKGNAALNALIPLDRLGGKKVKSVWEGGSFGDAFRANLALENETDRADAQVNPVAQTSGQIAGALAGPVPGKGLLAAATKGLGKAAPIARVAGEAAIQSGLYGLGTGNSTSATERLSNAGTQALRGTAGALAGYGLVRGTARAVSPIKSEAVRRLAKAGVTMTPGQRGGPVKRFAEQAAESIPGVGIPVRAAKARGVEQFNKAWTNEALSPIGVTLPKSAKVGNDSIAFAQKAVSDAYDKALSGISAPADDIFQQTLGAIEAKTTNLPPDQKAAFDAIMNLRIKPVLAGKSTLDGKSFQTVYRALQRDIAGLRKRGDPITDLTAESLQEVLDNFNDLAERYAGPSAQAFRKANEASARLSRVEDAAARPQSVGGVFTPSTAVSAASRKGYGTTTKNLARGDARMQALADAAKEVLPDNLPNSGTVDRGAALAAGGSLLSGGAAATVNPAFAAPLPLLTPYIPGLDQLFQQAALRGQGPLSRATAEQIRKAARVGGMIGVPLAIEKGK